MIVVVLTNSQSRAARSFTIEVKRSAGNRSVNYALVGITGDIKGTGHVAINADVSTLSDIHSRIGIAKSDVGIAATADCNIKIGALTKIVLADRNGTAAAALPVKIKSAAGDAGRDRRRIAVAGNVIAIVIIIATINTNILALADIQADAALAESDTAVIIGTAYSDINAAAGTAAAQANCDGGRASVVACNV